MKKIKSKEEMMEPTFLSKVWDTLQCRSSTQLEQDHNSNVHKDIQDGDSSHNNNLIKDQNDVREPSDHENITTIKIMTQEDEVNNGSSSPSSPLSMQDYERMQKAFMRELALKDKSTKDLFHIHQLAMTRLEQLERDLMVEKELKLKALQEIEQLRNKVEHLTVEKQTTEREIDKAVKLCESALEQLEQEKIDKKDKVEKAHSIRDDALMERDAVVARCNEAVDLQVKAETHLQNMKDFITEARVVDKTNETLHTLLKEQIGERMTLHNILEDLKGKIRVHVRIRPLSESEKDHSCVQTLIKSDNRSCEMTDNTKRRNLMKIWEFDKVLSGHSHEGNSQEEIFQDVKPLVTSAMDGFNVSIFAYGQTGGGKTYTMGLDGESMAKIDPSDLFIHKDIGLTPRIVVELFQLLNRRQSAFETCVTLNMFEVSVFHNANS